MTAFSHFLPAVIAPENFDVGVQGFSADELIDNDLCLIDTSVQLIEQEYVGFSLVYDIMGDCLSFNYCNTI